MTAIPISTTGKVSILNVLPVIDSNTAQSELYGNLKKLTHFKTKVEIDYKIIHMKIPVYEFGNLGDMNLAKPVGSLFFIMDDIHHDNTTKNQYNLTLCRQKIQVEETEENINKYDEQETYEKISKLVINDPKIVDIINSSYTGDDLKL